MSDTSRQGGPQRRLLTGAIVCGRCGVRLAAHCKTVYDWQGPTGARERSRRRSLARYVCARDRGGCGRLAILAWQTEGLCRAAIEMRTGLRLLGSLENQRRAISSAVQRIEVLPGRPGAHSWDARRVRIIWADGTAARGVPLDLRIKTSPPSLPSTATRRQKEAAWERWNAEGWRACFDKAGKAMAGQTPEGPK